MREILFRGKWLDNGEWIQGDLVQSLPYGIFRIVTQEPPYNYARVDSDTVGQFTGLTDKNGRKIFEGDIVSIYTPYNEKHNIGVIRFGYYASGIPAIYKKFQLDPESLFRTNLGFYIEWASEDDINPIDFGFWIQAYQDEPEVIGNIHDNPELLEVTE